MRISKIRKSLLCNFIIFIVLNLLFEANIKIDDYMINTIIYRMYDGKESYCNLYINNLLHLLLNKLFDFCNLPWFSILQVFSCFISLVIITCFLINYLEKNSAFFYAIIIVFSYELYIKITFTKTAGAVIFSGILLLYLGIVNELKGEIVTGLMWTLWGSLFRYDMLLLCVCTCVCFFVYLLWKEKKRKKLCTLIFSLIVIGILGKSLLIINQNMINQSIEWTRYYKDNSTNALLYNYGQITSQNYSEELNIQYGITSNDFELIKNSYVLETDYFDDNLLKVVANFFSPQKKAGIVRLLDAIKVFAPQLFKEYTIFFFIIIVVICVLFGGKTVKILAYGQLALMIAEYLYMLQAGRTRHHVTIIIIMISSVLLLYLMPVIKRNLMISLIMLSFIFWVINNYSDMQLKSYDISMNSSNETTTKEYSNDNFQKLVNITSNNNNLYIVDYRAAQNMYYIFSAYEVPPQGVYSNVYFANFYFLPQQRNMLTERKIENIISESVNNNIYYCIMEDEDDILDYIIVFLKEHYGIETQYEMVKKIDNIEVYSMKTLE